MRLRVARALPVAIGLLLPLLSSGSVRAMGASADLVGQPNAPVERSRPEAQSRQTPPAKETTPGTPVEQAQQVEQVERGNDRRTPTANPTPTPARADAETEADAARREALLHVSARGARVRIGGDVTIGEQERVNEVVTLFGRTEVLGIVTGDLFTLGGDVHLGPNALVRGEVVVVGGTVHAAQGAYVGGQISEMRLSASDFRFWLPNDHEVTIAFQPDWPRIARFVFVSGIMKTLFWFVVCAVLLAIAPGAIGRARQQAAASPIASLAVGMAAVLLFVPVMLFLAVVLSLSIVGVPLLALLPILALAFGLAMVVGFTGVASGIGGRLVGRATPIAALLLGLILIWSTGLTGRYVWTLENGRLGWGVALLAIGTVIELIVCTLGLGATLIAWSANRRRTRVTPVPAPPVVSDIDPLPQQL